MKKIIKALVIGSFVLYLLALFSLLFMRSGGYWQNLSWADYVRLNSNFVPVPHHIAVCASIVYGQHQRQHPADKSMGQFADDGADGAVPPLFFQKGQAAGGVFLRDAVPGAVGRAGADLP